MAEVVLTASFISINGTDLSEHITSPSTCLWRSTYRRPPRSAMSGALARPTV